MKLALDCNALIEISRPDDPVALFRFQYLVRELDAVFVVPTPVIAEYLVQVEAEGVAWLATQRRRKNFLILPFDYRAAQECALLERQALAAGMKQTGKLNPRQKVKVDRQILAVARVNQCETLFTGDHGLAALAGWLDMECRAIGDLPLPPEDAQMSLIDIDASIEPSVASVAIVEPPAPVALGPEQTKT